MDKAFLEGDFRVRLAQRLKSSRIHHAVVPGDYRK